MKLVKTDSKILIIAGSDSSGGAGIQADIKTVTALGGYAMTAVTAITVQNTTGVNSVIPINPKKIEENYSNNISNLGQKTFTDTMRIIKNFISNEN